MPEVFRSRDCLLLVKGDSVTVAVDSELIQNGWTGGSGVAWTDSPRDELMVTRSDGAFGCFLVWGSDESSDQYTAMTGQFPYYGYGQAFFGGCVISTTSYERYTWASRQAGPLVPITYTPTEKLYFSYRGLWTNEDEWTEAGDGRAPAEHAGVVMQIPKENNKFFLTIQTMM